MKRILYSSIVPLLILTVTAVQYYNVKNHHLTTWKGGGFGMYADFHWLYREIWIFGSPEGVDPLEEFADEAERVRQFPTEKNIKELTYKVKSRYNLGELTVEVWEPYYQRESGMLMRKMLKRVYVP